MNSSALEPGSPQLGLLVLDGLHFFGHHGVTAAERRAGGEFKVDLEVTADLSRAQVSDDVADTVNYVDLYEVVRRIVEDSQFHLVEAMASRIAEAILKLPGVERVQLRVTKPRRLPAQHSGFAVEITLPR